MKRCRQEKYGTAVAILVLPGSWRRLHLVCLKREPIHIWRRQCGGSVKRTDVKLGYIYDGETAADYRKWKFAKWLPCMVRGHEDKIHGFQ